MESKKPVVTEDKAVTETAKSKRGAKYTQKEADARIAEMIRKAGRPSKGSVNKIEGAQK